MRVSPLTGVAVIGEWLHGRPGSFRTVSEIAVDGGLWLSGRYERGLPPRGAHRGHMRGWWGRLRVRAGSPPAAGRPDRADQRRTPVGHRRPAQHHPGPGRHGTPATLPRRGHGHWESSAADRCWSVLVEIVRDRLRCRIGEQWLDGRVSVGLQAAQQPTEQLVRDITRCVFHCREVEALYTEVGVIGAWRSVVGPVVYPVAGTRGYLSARLRYATIRGCGCCGRRPRRPLGAHARSRRS